MLPSHAFIIQFLAARRAAGRDQENVEGDERVSLKADLWPLLTPKQRLDYSDDNPGGPKTFDNWVTYVLRAKRKYTIQPDKTNHRYPGSKKNVGDANEHSQENQRAKNQKSSIIASKNRYEANHPNRMQPTIGTQAKKEQSRRYFQSEKGKEARKRHKKRQKERKRELRRATCEIEGRT